MAPETQANVWSANDFLPYQALRLFRNPYPPPIVGLVGLVGLNHDRRCEMKGVTRDLSFPGCVPSVSVQSIA